MNNTENSHGSGSQQGTILSGIWNIFRPTSRTSGGTNQNNNGVALPVGLADDQAKDFDFEKTEMKYDSTGMFHWGPAKNLEDCILVSPSFNAIYVSHVYYFYNAFSNNLCIIYLI